MIFVLGDTQESLLDAIRDGVSQNVIEQAIPDVDTLKRTKNGDIQPYYAIQFGDITPGRVRNMATVWGDDYRLPFYIQSVGPTGEIVRQLQNQMLQTVLGLSFDYSGNIRKRAGLGGMFPIRNASGSVEAYIAPSGFDLLVQLAIGDTP